MVAGATPLTPLEGYGNVTVMADAVPAIQRREQLLVLAAEIVGRDGASALTMERLAERAGVTKPIVYRHFANRGALVKAMVEAAWQRLDDAVAKALTAVPEGPDRIRVAFSASIAQMARESPGVRLLMDDRGADPVLGRIHEDRWQRQQDEWANNFRLDFALTDKTARAAAEVLQGALRGAVHHASRSRSAAQEAQDVFATAVFATLSTLALHAKRSRT